MRICSLLPSATEIVAELGLVESLVGISEECDWPPEVHGLPVVTASRVETTRLTSLEIDRAVREAVGDGRPLYAIDRALLETLQPDLILTQNLCAVCAVSADNVNELCATDAEVVALDAHTLAEIEGRIRPRSRGRRADAIGVRRRVARATLCRWPLDPRDGGDRRRPRRPRTRGCPFLPDLMGGGAGGAARTGRRRTLRLRPYARSPRGGAAATRLPRRCRRFERLLRATSTAARRWDRPTRLPHPPRPRRRPRTPLRRARHPKTAWTGDPR